MNFYPGLIDETQQALALTQVEQAHIDATRHAGSACVVSHDWSYAYKEEQVIDGPPRLALADVIALMDVFFCRRCLQRDQRLVRILP